MLSRLLPTLLVVAAGLTLAAAAAAVLVIIDRLRDRKEQDRD
ncbi:hypothetical protein [Streptomyces xantholiticus]|nr:hypothetical protein [Streptomyces xantholiticus]GGW29352.1 hypothetical protein GCM10010381_12420 [Streptomyces xantholiticus]